ncbi:MAG TPA: MerR family DNA-binding transcriptional regulator [Acidimicrobiia bacterium]
MQIGEVARQVGVATSAIRFCDDAGVLPEPDRTPFGYRDCGPTVVGPAAVEKRSGRSSGEAADFDPNEFPSEGICRILSGTD